MSPPHTQTVTAPAVSLRPDVLELDPGGGGYLIGSRCPACGAHFFPARQVCSGCLTEDLATVRLSGYGNLYTYTVVRQSVPGFDVPYLIGYVDLPEGVRILGQLSGLDADVVQFGMPLVLATQKVGTNADGREVVGYCFRAGSDAVTDGNAVPDSNGIPDGDGGGHG